MQSTSWVRRRTRRSLRQHMRSIYTRPVAFGMTILASRTTTSTMRSESVVMIILCGSWGRRLVSLRVRALMLYRRQEAITEHMDRFGFTLADSSTAEAITEQRGVFRTNCLDWYCGTTNLYCSFLTVAGTAWTERTSCKISCHAKRLSSTLVSSIASGYKPALSGPTTGSCGQKMVMPCRAYTLVLGL
jgi:hypothetical protein